MDAIASNVGSLRYFGAESALILGTLVLIVLDVVTRRRWQARRLGILQAVALGTVAVAAGGVLALPGDEQVALFNGLIVHDPFATFFKWIFLATTAITVLLTGATDEPADSRKGEFYGLLMAVCLGLFLTASAVDLLMIYLALELVGIASYVLAGFTARDRRASEAALKYVIYGGVASGVMLFGMSLLYGLFGSTRIGAIAGSVEAYGTQAFLYRVTDGSPAAELALVVAVIFVLAGVGYKVASVPFHMWAPDVYEGAPTPFTAFLSVGSKAAGFAVLLRFFYGAFEAPAADGVLRALSDLPWPVILGVVAAATMTLGNLTALTQSNIKRFLAYSSIAHAGYALMGASAANTEGMTSVLIYMGVYLVMNLGAFAVVIAIRRATGSEQIADYRGLSVRSPLLAAGMAVFLFSLTGLPPFAGFIGKFYLFYAVLAKGGAWYWILAAIGAINSVVSLYYYARIVRTMYLDAPATRERLSVRPVYTWLSLGLAVPNVALIVYWTPLAHWAHASLARFWG